MTPRCYLAVLVIFCLVQTTGRAESRPLELKWNELAPLISGHPVEFTLPGGATIKGEVATVRDDALVIDVKKTSDSKAYPKGNASIPRASITLIKLERTHGSWGRAMGTTLGVLTGMAVGGYTAATTTDSAAKGIPVFLGIAGAISLAGYSLGRAADRKVTTIRIVP